MAYFHGPWFVTQGGDELVHMTNHPFYPRESFISTIQVNIYIYVFLDGLSGVKVQNQSI